MNIFYKRLYWFLLLFLWVLPGFAQTGTYSHIIGSLGAKDKIFAPAYLQELNTRLENLEATSGYALYIEVNEDILHGRQYKEMSEEKLQQYRDEKRLDRIRSFKKLKADKTRLGKGVVAHLDFIHYPKPGTTGEIGIYYMQTLSLGPVLSSYAKSSLSAFHQDTRLNYGQDNYSVNKDHLEKLVSSILAVFEEDKSKPQDNYQFGPLVVKITAPQKVKGSSKTVSGVKLDEYTSSAASCELPLKSPGFQSLAVPVTAGSISYFYDENSGTYSDVRMNYQGGTDSLFAGKLGFFNVFATGFAVQVSSEGKVTGSVQVKSYLDRDVQYGHLVVLKAGLGGAYSYTYGGGRNFDGSYDFSGLKNFQLIALKNKTPFASFSGSFNASGTVSGTIQNLKREVIKASAVTMVVETFRLDVDYSVKSGITVKGGEFTGAFSGLPGISGDLLLSGKYDQQGAINAEVQQSGSKLSIFGMELQNLKLGVNLDTSLEVTALEGSFFMKHPSFNNTIGVTAFKWNSEEGIETIIASGSVDYKGFYFNLTSISYMDGALVCDAEMEINTTGQVAHLAVTEFTIDENGEVTIGGISGTIRRFPLNLTFAAQFDDDRFAGYFKGDLSKIGVEGTVDLGQQPFGNTKYTFCYLKLVITTPGIPIAPFPVKVKSLGAEVGYNYYIDFAHRSDMDQIGVGPGDPKKGSYLAGATLEITDLAEMVSVTGNPIVQFSGETVDFHMKGDVKIPRVDPWFTQQVEVNYALPSHKIYGSFNTNFKVPRATGLLIDAGNLGMDFYFDQQKWYVGRKNMQAKFFRALSINGDAEFQGTYDNVSAFSAYLRAAMDLDFHWSGRKTIKVFSYDAVDASAHMHLLFHQEAMLSINKEGLAGSFDASLRADGGISLQVCPSCNYDWTKVEIAVNADIAGKLAFQNTKLHMNGTALLGATICSYEGKFEFGVDYIFDPSNDGASSFTYNAGTSYQQVPTTPSPFVIPASMPQKGKANNYLTEFNEKKDLSKALAKYPNVRKYLGSIQRTLAADYESFDKKIRAASAYILTKFDNSEPEMLLAYAKELKANPSNEAKFNKTSAEFDKWFAANSENNIDRYPNIKAKLPELRAALKAKGGAEAVIDNGLSGVNPSALTYLNDHIETFTGVSKDFTGKTTPKELTVAWNNAAKEALFERLKALGLTALSGKVNVLPSKDKFLIDFSGASDNLLKFLNTEPGLVNAWKAGIRIKEENSEVVLLDKVAEIGRFKEGKLKVKVWKWVVKNKPVDTTEGGYILVTGASGAGFDLGFNNRTLTAEEVNEYLIEGQGKDPGEPYKNRTIVEEKILSGSKIYFVEYLNNKKANPGQWASKNKIITINGLRDTLAVLQDWKDEIKDDLVVREYKVIKDLRVRSGIIGPQLEKSGPNIGMTYLGGGHQFEVIDYLGEGWSKYLEELSVTDLNYKIDYSSLDIPRAMNHVKYRDLAVSRAKGIGGCHDKTEFNKYSSEYVVVSRTPLSIPNVELIEYQLYALDPKTNLPTGGLKTTVFKKTVYDSNYWTDVKLENALKEALQNVVNKNYGEIPSEWLGKTKDGYLIRGYYRDGKIDSFFFE